MKSWILRVQFPDGKQLVAMIAPAADWMDLPVVTYTGAVER
jgi:hypothetical protein